MALKRFFVSLLALISVVTIIQSPVEAQENLLENPGFEQAGDYHRSSQVSRADFTFAPGWDGWQTNSPQTESWMNIDPIAFPHGGSTRYEGLVSQNIGRGDATFTAAAYQVVNNIPEGTTLRASAWVFQENDPGSDARTRIGIGSNVGGNPFGGAIEWSPWLTALRSWQQISVEATVPAGSVTVFIYSTQSRPNPGNQMYYDDASLVVVGEGEVSIGEPTDPAATAAPPTNTPQPYAPFVNPQSSDDTGRIEHVVAPGDTLAAIAVAYGVSINDIRELNNLGPGFLQIGQVLLIREGLDATFTPTTGPTSTPRPTSTSSSTGSGSGSTSDLSGASSGFASPTPRSILAVATSQAETSSEDAATEEATTESAPTEESPTEEAEDVDDSTPVTETEDASATPSEPTNTPTPTVVPPTATDAPPAPVEEGENADPLAVDAAVCVSMYEDANQNNYQDGESLLAGGTIVLSAANGGEEQEYVTDGESEPYCFEGLEMGTYTVSATAPDGYGVLRSNELVVNVQPGQRFPLRFGAAEGVEVAAAPTTVPNVDNEVTDASPDLIEEAPDTVDNLRNVAGIIVIGLAAVVLISGIGIAIISRR